MSAPVTYHPHMYYAPPPQRPPYSGMAVAALVVGIVSLMIGWLFFGLPCIAAIVLGHLALGETKPGAGRRGNGMAVAALAVAYPALLISVAALLITLAPILP